MRSSSKDVALCDCQHCRICRSYKDAQDNLFRKKQHLPCIYLAQCSPKAFKSILLFLSVLLLNNKLIKREVLALGMGVSCVDPSRFYREAQDKLLGRSEPCHACKLRIVSPQASNSSSPLLFLLLLNHFVKSRQKVSPWGEGCGVAVVTPWRCPRVL